MNKYIPKVQKDRLANGFKPYVLGIGFEEEAINTVGGQNSNNSVRITDAFMRCVENDEDWSLTSRTTGEVVKIVKARMLWDKLCSAAHFCADPGILDHDTINSWNTCATDGEIQTTNPCFVGETLVDTSEGPISIENLVTMTDFGVELPYAFCFDVADALPRLKRIKRAWASNRTRHLVDVTLDDGRTFRCTPEHQWLLRNGQYVQAQDLMSAKVSGSGIGLSLRKIGRAPNRRDGGCAITSRVTERAPRGFINQAHFIWEQINGPVPMGYHLHHRNENKGDDRLGNFEALPGFEHLSSHTRGAANPRFIDVPDATLTEVYDAILSRGKRVSVSTWNGYVQKNGLKGLVPLARSVNGEGRIQGTPWPAFINRIEIARQQLNARVVSVTEVTLDEPIDVFDVEVEDCHNFAVRTMGDPYETGIVVHNCAEFHHLDGSACNLASLKLTAFLQEEGTLDLDAYEHVLRLFTIVLDISVSMASFPAKEFAEGAYNYRTLGLGYADLGGLLMRLALPYDSDEGRALAAGLTALMTGVAYRTSAEMAAELGPFPRWEANAEPMRRVLRNHARAAGADDSPFNGLTAIPHLTTHYQVDLWHRVVDVWAEVLHAESFRNAQTTLIAPTGTISFVLDSDTTGCEPDYALVKHKNLAGGGTMRIVNQAVPAALRRLGYGEDSILTIVQSIEIDGDLTSWSDWLKTKEVFACVADLAPMAHVKMVAAIQPFLSGAASKTVNLPNSATVEDVSNIYREAHRLGIKAIALYRDGSKLTQPLAAAQPRKKVVPNGKHEGVVSAPRDKSPPPVTGAQLFDVISEAWRRDPPPNVSGLERGTREPLPPRRRGETQKARVAGQTLYWRTGEYPDGRLGELFIDLAGAGSTLDGFANCLAKMTSIALQFGAPAGVVIDALMGVKFEPAGHVELHERIKWASSIPELIARDLAIAYQGREDLANVVRAVPVPAGAVVALDRRAVALSTGKPTGETCPRCGGVLVQSGTCKTCADCGESMGGCG